jgi:uncharacterized repeat protein (TIGR01451 family)
MGDRRANRWGRILSTHLLVAAAGLLAMAPSASAAPPAAGTVIGNQAVATYQSAGQTFSVTSNRVETTIKTIAGVQIENDTSKDVIAGGNAFFPHTVTNVGNAADRYDLTTSDLGSGLSVAGIYADDDCDGVPNTLTAITRTGSLNPGESACVVIEVNVAAGATGSPTLKITAASTLETAGNFVSGTPNQPNDSDTDTVNVVDGAVLQFTKNMSLAADTDGSGSLTPGDRVRVRFNYSNTGGADATDVEISDVLPDELVYVAGTGKWSDGGTMNDAGGATDHTNGQGHTISYSFDEALGLKAVISALPVGKTSYIEFEASVADGAAGTIANTGTIVSKQTGQQSSNEARITVDNGDAIAVTLADRSATDPAYAGRSTSDLPDDNLGGSVISENDGDGEANDTVAYVTGYLPSSTPVPFEVIITNHSNTAQRFNLSAAPGNYPSGTTFTFVADGAPILDTNGDGQPDVQVAANTVSKVSVRANLPSGSARSADAEAWEATVTATAIANPAVSNRTRLQIKSAVGGGTVDLQNGGDKAIGAAVDNGGEPWTTVETDPGEAAEFTLVVVNKRSVPDSFNLSFSETNFAPGAMPAGWQVVFTNGSETVTNTGVIGPGASATFTARVTPPASAPPSSLGETNIYFRAASTSSPSVVDTKLDRVTVRQRVDLAISTDQTAQAAPGGVVVITHVLENRGNVSIKNGAIGYDPAFPSFAESLWHDINGNGVWDSSDKLVNSLADIVGEGSLTPGDTALLFSRVQVPSTGASGLSESAKIVVGTNLTGPGGASVTDQNTGNNAVTETVTVVSGNVAVAKVQALDAECNGEADVDFSPHPQAASPGECIVYRVTAVNVGTANADGLRIDDAVPAYTTYVGSSAAAAGGSEASISQQPGDGATGAIQSKHGTLSPGQEATLTFRVRIDQ